MTVLIFCDILTSYPPSSQIIFYFLPAGCLIPQSNPLLFCTIFIFSLFWSTIMMEHTNLSVSQKGTLS